MGDVTDDAFSQQVLRLRAAYQRKRQGTKLFPPIGQPVLEMELVRGTPPSMRIWYEDGTELGRHVHLFDLPGTLSGDILRLERDLPSPVEDHFEDISDLVAKLPVVEVNPDAHFVKKGKYRSEIENLLLCQGGACPGTPVSPHLIRLLGASPDGELVFEKLSTRASTLGRFSSLRVYRTWILGLIHAWHVCTR
ncbi:hypothetical protein NEMBOFW57_008804 [Staphylotrichum longicolle]|uniref:Uncharacterized protein n=1 Tax=Staphylotrichum longicolle TaxID=669026 RepID=A0AAD4EWA9_9PEZI|nr:hypothetical protein NEMBOFW57_008804 [Staphylotrichum longicolle]